jgi:hypothetical protein
MSFRLALLFVLIATTAAAEERCISSETPRHCLQRLIAARAYEAAQNALSQVTTGPSTASSPVQTAMTDFLTAATTHIDASSAKGGNKSLTFAYNLPASALQSHLEVTLTDPSLSAAVKEENDPVKAAALKKELGSGDDVAISLAINPLTQHVGRGLAPHRQLFESMMSALVSNPAPATATIPTTSFDTRFIEIFPDAAARMAAMMEVETLSRSTQPAATETRLTMDFARLVSNQPQLFFTFVDRQRQATTGPNQRGVRVTWEIRTDNLNSFRRNEGRGCEAEGTCLAAFNDYANRTANGHNHGQFALAVEYLKIEANDPRLTEPPATELAAKTLTFSAVYGREITSFVSSQPGRFDFAVSYNAKETTTVRPVAPSTQHGIIPMIYLNQQVQQLPPARTRLSVTATVTQPLWNGVSIPFAVAWKDDLVWVPGTGSPLVSPEQPPGNGHLAPFSRHERRAEVDLGIRYQFPTFRRPPSPPKKECCCR